MRRASSFCAEDIFEAFADATSLPRAAEWLDPRGFTFSDRPKQEARKRRWYLANRDVILEARRVQRRDDPEVQRTIHRRFHARHRAARNAAHRAYYQGNAERLRAARRAYHAARKDTP